jgi:hypothetical protein
MTCHFLCNMCSQVCHPGVARPVPALCPPSGGWRKGRAVTALFGQEHVE